jgi:hypothetical protein
MNGQDRIDRLGLAPPREGVCFRRVCTDEWTLDSPGPCATSAQQQFHTQAGGCAGEQGADQPKVPAQ